MPENIEKKLKDFEAEGVKRIKLALTDIDGVLRGKYISFDKFRSVVQATGGFCDCVLGWDVNDQLYDNTTFTGWHTAYPDALCRLDLSTERRLPDEGNIPFYLAEFDGGDGEGEITSAVGTIPTAGADASRAMSKQKARGIAHRSWKSFMRLLTIPNATIAWSFSATTVSGGYARTRGHGKSRSVG